MSSLRRRLRGVALAGACTALVVALVPAQAATKSPGAWMKPGVPMQGQQHPDPTAYTLGPLTYVASTEHGGADLPVAWSADLKTFTARTQYAGADGRRDGETRTGYFNDAIHDPPWGVTIPCGDASKGGCDPKSLWAPGIAFAGGQWLGYHAVKVSTSRTYSPYGRLAIYRTKAASPLGEFRSGSSSPIVTTDPKRDPAGAIDPEVVTSPSSGKTYLLYKTEGSSGGNYPKIWSRQIDPSSGAFAAGSKATQLLTVSPGSWEGTVVENPSMVYADGAWLLFYSGNRYATTRYATAYAVCKGPLGPCSKKGRVLTNKTGSYGPGGADAFVDDRGRYLLAYHAWKGHSGTTGTGGRTLRTAELTVVGGKVAVEQRELTPSPGTDDGYWFGEDGGSFTAKRRTTGGAYTPFVADLNGADGRDDVGLYAPWAAADASLVSRPDRADPTSAGGTEVGQAGTFLPVSGDFDGDGLKDVYWYQPGEDPLPQIRKEEPEARVDQLWRARADGGWTKQDVPQDRAATPVVGNVDDDPADELWWVQPGSGSDEAWDWQNGSFVRSAVTIPAPGTMAPAVGDLDGNGRDEVLWYAPGTATATIWWDGSHATSTDVAVGAETQKYGRRPLIGNFDGAGGAEVLWYGPRSRPDALWRDVTRATRTPVGTTTGVRKGGTYQGLVGDFDGDGNDDVYWYG